MKRKFMPLTKKTAKSAFALSLAATMVVPTGVSAATDASVSDDDVTIPAPIATLDFNDGLQGVKRDFPGLEITKGEEVYFQKTAEEVGSSETVDANGIVYTGAGDTARYYKGLISNQPTTAWDDERGTVLKIGKSYQVPAIYKTKSAGGDNAQTAAKLDAELPYNAVTGEALVQPGFTANSEIVIDNPYGSEELREELTEFGEYDLPNDETWVKYNGKYQPLWTKGLTMSYWIKVPSDENGEYKPSSAFRWELLDQEYYQADDYAKYLACSYYDIEWKKNTEEDSEYEAYAKLEESKVCYESDYYFKYADVKQGVTDEDGAPVSEDYSGAGYKGPVYDSRFFDEKVTDVHTSLYYQFNPVYRYGYLAMADGSRQAQDKNTADAFYAKYHTLDIDEGSYVRRGLVDGELQIDVDNSIFWVPDNNLGIQTNPNRTDTHNSKQGFHNGDVFFMNSWQEGQKKDAAGNGTYQSAKTYAVSPVTSMEKRYNSKGDEIEPKMTKNGNCDTWHQVTVTFQNDWVEFYVDGECADVGSRYSSRGLLSLDNSKSFKRLNKGTGLRYGWGSEKGAKTFAFGNYVCRLLMDWMTDEEATLHIGGAGQYAKEYAQATGSCEFSLDDVKFYGELLTEKQIVAAYQQEVAAMEQDVDTVGNKVDITRVTDVAVKGEAPTTGKVTIEGKSLDAVTLPANSSLTKATGAKVANPFAGKDLEGATIAYWVKQDGVDYNSMVSFIDAEKYVYNPKEDGGDASSILYIHNDGEASFIEGYSNTSVGDKLKNACATSSDATGAAVIAEKTSSDWTYVTVTMTNAGLKYYVDGELVENLCENPAGVRFLDGYFTRLRDEESVEKRFGMYGGTNNQGASTLMDFLTYEDTELYFGFQPMKGGMNYTKTSGCTFAGVKTVDAALTDDQVKTLYANRFKEGNTGVLAGDVDGNGKVELADAQNILKVALKIISETSLKVPAAADVDTNGKVELADAQLALKKALKIIQ